jgi:tartrate-resistant acid phosphatase type 5
MIRRRSWGWVLGLGILAGWVFALVTPLRAPAAPVVARTGAGACPAQIRPPDTQFAIIGDMGVRSAGQLYVANQFKRWKPDFVVALGDIAYNGDSTTSYDSKVGRYYWEYLHPYTGQYTQSVGVTVTPAGFNRFWPVPGNHDWDLSNGLAFYRAFFALPGNERYYTVTLGSVALFMLDSDNDPQPGNRAGLALDNQGPTSAQALWLKEALAASTAPWKLVVFHHPPYTSAPRGPSTWMHWPFKDWGAHMVLSGHEHMYERLEVDGLPYVVNGAGGAPLTPILSPVNGSILRGVGHHGAQRVLANRDGITFAFVSTEGTDTDTDDKVLDTFTLGCPPTEGVIQRTRLPVVIRRGERVFAPTAHCGPCIGGHFLRRHGV